MRIAILDVTEHPLPLLEGLPTPASQIRDWLAPALPEAELVGLSIAEGTPLPKVGDYDGYVVSGSEKGVYDEAPWMDGLRALLLDCREARTPVYGICFGHQILADTWGGRAAKAECGMIVGAKRFDYRGREVDAHAWHQDQVHEVPPGATVTGSAAHCPIGALDYDFPARSVQFHPEYTADAMRALFERGRDVFVTPDQIAEAEISFETAAVPRDLAAEDAAHLFRQHARA